jgi:excisionase family DNA binding protein
LLACGAKEEKLMTVETPIPEHLVQPDPSEEESIAALDLELKEIMASGGQTAKLVSPTGHEVEIPASAFHALQLAAKGMALGQTILLVPQGQELTTKQAADLLHVSRPHLVRLLEKGEIGFHKVGTHRRVKIEDVLEYRDLRNRRRREELDRLTEISEELPGGYR